MTARDELQCQAYFYGLNVASGERVTLNWVMQGGAAWAWLSTTTRLSWYSPGINRLVSQSPSLSSLTGLFPAWIVSQIGSSIRGECTFNQEISYYYGTGAPISPNVKERDLISAAFSIKRYTRVPFISGEWNRREPMALTFNAIYYKKKGVRPKNQAAELFFVLPVEQYIKLVGMFFKEEK